MKCRVIYASFKAYDIHSYHCYIKCYKEKVINKKKHFRRETAKSYLNVYVIGLLYTSIPLSLAKPV
jgi:hypothetical protein